MDRVSCDRNQVTGLVYHDSNVFPPKTPTITPDHYWDNTTLIIMIIILIIMIMTMTIAITII